MGFTPYSATVGNQPTPLAIASGGTGSTTAGAALTSLGIPTPFSVTNGGTGLSGVGAQLPWVPADNGLLAANAALDGIAGATQIFTGGTQYLMLIQFRVATTVTNIWFITSTASSGTSTGSFVGLYNSAGTLLSGSADCIATFNAAAGPQSVALTTPQAMAAGSSAWVVMMSNASVTQPTLRCVANNTQQISNLNLAAAGLRAAVNGTGRTTLAASVTPGSNTGGNPFWVGVN